jgi:CP family cyanate transporter-like MFS transporter
MSGSEASEPVDRHPFRWVIFAAMCGVYFAFGVLLMAIPPMVGEVQADLDVGRSGLGLALGAWAFIYIFTAPPAGRVTDRIGLRRSLLIGSVLIAVSGMIQASSQTLGTLWLAIAILGIGGPLISVSAPKLVAVWFTDHDEQPFAVGVYTSAPALGGVAALALTNTVLLPALGDWRRVVLAESALCLLAGLAWVIVSGRAPEPPPAETLHPDAAGHDRSWRSLLSSTGVRLALVLGLGSFFINQALNSWLPDALEEQSGLSATAASVLVAASLAIGIGARLVIPRFATPRLQTRMLNGVMGLMALALITIAVAPTGLAAVATLGLGARAALNSLVIVVLMRADRVNQANMGTANGLWFSVAGIGGAVGPFAIGAIADTDAGFTGAFALLAALLAVLIAVVSIDNHRRATQARAPAD